MKQNFSHIKDLVHIRNFILQQVDAETSKTQSRTSLVEKVKDFLNRLIREKEGILVKDPLQIKAGRQLLCSIGIDLLNQSVPLYHYINIFENLNFTNYEKQARDLFSDCINDENLVFRETDKKHTRDFTIMVCPIKDITHYVDEAKYGIIASDQESWRQRQILEASEGLTLKTNRFDKKHHYRHFWITTEQEFERILSRNRTTNFIVDQLGLSHFDFQDEGYQYFFYIKLEDMAFETFKPNATVVNWGNPRVAYISYKDKSAGKTFSISGYFTEDVGIAERVFHVLEIEPEKQQNAKIILLKDNVVPPIEIECSDIIQEAIKRFKTQYQHA